MPPPLLTHTYLSLLNASRWQFLTHAFCHGSYEHLSGNLFNLVVFGKLVRGGF